MSVRLSLCRLVLYVQRQFRRGHIMESLCPFVCVTCLCLDMVCETGAWIFLKNYTLFFHHIELCTWYFHHDWTIFRYFTGFFSPQHYELSHFVSNIEMIYSLRDYCFCLGEEWNHCVHLHVVRPFLWETSAWIFLKICTLFSVSYNLYSNKTRIVLKFISFSSSAVYNISDMLLYE